MLTSENQGVSLGKKKLKRPNRGNLSSGGFFGLVCGSWRALILLFASSLVLPGAMA